MSSAAMKWASRQIIEHRGLTHLVATLAMVADKRGQTWRSQATIAAQLAASERSVRLWLLALEKLGVIQRARRSRGRGLGRSSDLIRLRLERDFTVSGEAVRAILQPAKPAACNSKPADAYNRQSVQLQPANAAGDKGSDQQKVEFYQDGLSPDYQSAQAGKPALKVIGGGRA